jgi:hypothetical protein
MRISQRAFGSIKEALAKDRLAEAVGAAQVPETYTIPKSRGGRDLTEDEGIRIAAQVGAGRSLLLLLGDNSRKTEQATVVDTLFKGIRKAKARGKKMRWDFDKAICKAVAVVAVHEFVQSACQTCLGAGQVKLNADVNGRQAMLTCQSCLGTGMNKWKQSERAENINKALCSITGDNETYVMVKHPRWEDILACIDWSRSRLSESIRFAVEETAHQLEIT